MTASARAGFLLWLRAQLRALLRPPFRLRLKRRTRDYAAGSLAGGDRGPGSALTSISLSISPAVREPITYPGGSSS